MKRSIHEKGLTRNGSAQPHPDKPGKYRLLDGVHRWSAFKGVGVAEVDAIVPKQLTEDKARDTARRAYSKNTTLRSADIGKAIRG